jgi:hypothetical protein
MTEKAQELVARLRAGDHNGKLTILRGVVHDVKCLEAADWITAALAREVVLLDALAHSSYALGWALANCPDYKMPSGPIGPAIKIVRAALEVKT